MKGSVADIAALPRTGCVIRGSVGTPPCDFCRRDAPCECSTLKDRLAGDETCMCTCGRCLVEDPDEVAAYYALARRA